MSETFVMSDSGVRVVGDLAARYKLAEAQLAILPPPNTDLDEDGEDKWGGLRDQCAEVMAHIERISRLEAQLAEANCKLEAMSRRVSDAEWKKYSENKAHFALKRNVVDALIVARANQPQPTKETE